MYAPKYAYMYIYIFIYALLCTCAWVDRLELEWRRGIL